MDETLPSSEKKEELQTSKQGFSFLNFRPVPRFPPRSLNKTLDVSKIQPTQVEISADESVHALSNHEDTNVVKNLDSLPKLNLSRLKPVPRFKSRNIKTSSDSESNKHDSIDTISPGTSSEVAFKSSRTIYKSIVTQKGHSNANGISFQPSISKMNLAPTSTVCNETIGIIDLTEEPKAAPKIISPKLREEDNFVPISKAQPSTSPSVIMLGNEHNINKPSEINKIGNEIINIRERIQLLTRTLQRIDKNCLPDNGLKLEMQLKNLKLELSSQLRKHKSAEKVMEEQAGQNTLKLKERLQQEANFFSGTNTCLPVPQAFGKAAQSVRVAESLTGDALMHLHSALRSCPSEELVDSGPKGLNVELLPHQKQAMTWLLWREQQHPKGGILADDMGLGKTLTMIALVLRKKELRQLDQENTWHTSEDDLKGGTLVVCPASVLRQWEAEVKKRCHRGLLKTWVYHGKSRTQDTRALMNADIVFTTYNLVAREGQIASSIVSLDGLPPAKSGPLFSIVWDRVILDEAHIIRNPKTESAKSACLLRSTYRWALTGTPIHNKLLDLYSLISFLKFTPFSNDMVWRHCAENHSVLGQERLKAIMKSIMLRRTKEELQSAGQLDCLPTKTIQTIEVHLEEEENKIYQHLLKQSRTLMFQFLAQRRERQQQHGESTSLVDRALEELVAKGIGLKKGEKGNCQVQASHMLLQLLRLRQICCHTALVKSKIDEENMAADGIEGNDDVTNLIEQMNEMSIAEEQNILSPNNPIFDSRRKSSKIRAALNVLAEIHGKGEKAVLVSQWTSMLDLIEAQLQRKGIKSAMFNGKLDAVKRQEIIQTFNEDKHGPSVLLLSLTAGGTGVNLIGGNHLFLLDIHWNPQLEAQAMDRIYRVGQKRPVNIYKFICVNTVEQNIEKIQEKKLEIAQCIVDAKNKTKLDFEDLKSLFLSN